MPTGNRSELPASLKAQTSGMSPQHVALVEFYGALIDRIRATGAVSISLSFDERGQPEIGADYEDDGSQGATNGPAASSR